MEGKDCPGTHLASCWKPLQLVIRCCLFVPGRSVVCCTSGSPYEVCIIVPEVSFFLLVVLYETYMAQNVSSSRTEQHHLVMQEIASPLEASVLSQDSLLVSPEQQKDNSLQLQLQPSLALWHALQRYASLLCSLFTSSPGSSNCICKCSCRCSL